MANAPADLSKYATHFNELSTEEHELVFDINAIYPLSELRDQQQNVTDNESEYQLTTAADTNDTTYLQSQQRGEYTAGFMCQAGIGLRLPSTPTGDSTARWGYYETDGAGDPLNGVYFGADSDGLFVCRVYSGQKEKVYQDEWNRDKLDSEQYALNPSDETLDVSDGLVYRIDFTYYGYGPIEMKILMDDDDDDNYGDAKLVTAHTFHVKERTSTDNTNLPVRAEIESGGTTNDALDLYVGGRQFSVVGKRTNNRRTSWHYLDTLSGVDETKWYHAISFKLKDGTDIGSIDFRKVLGEVRRFYADTDANTYKWQIRRDTVPDNPSWETPESHEDKPDETAFKVDTQSADVEDGSGNDTGVNIDGGMLEEGQKNEAAVSQEEIDGEVEGEQVVSLLFKATPGGSGSVSEILFKLGERW
jgi:hypothetical protein